MDHINTTATIICQDHIWQLDKETLTSKSKFFNAAFCGQFSEASTATINLHEEDPETVALLIRWIQSKTYPEPLLDGPDRQPLDFDLGQEDSAQDSLQKVLYKINLAIDIFATAVKYGVEDLQDKAAKEVRDAFNIIWRDDLEVPDDEYWAMVGKVYDSTPIAARLLRDHFLLVTRVQYGSPIRDRSEDFLELLEECTELKEDLQSHHYIEGWHCAAADCRQSVMVLIRACKCPCKEDICSRSSCLEKYVADSTCWECGANGTVAPEDLSSEARIC